ncbi:MAG: glutamate--tRNA ligase [Planctomycetota bacterium]|jgi:glutamyl-tRNA synthetase
MSAAENDAAAPAPPARPAGTVVTRVAPSPTGEPHVGTAYAALFNWAWARRHGGRFILRIEDTDRTRSTPESEAEIHTALAWLGIEADESPAQGGEFGPYRQSERSAIYAHHAAQLIAGGHAYRCFCTSERLAELRTFQRAAKRPSGYDGACRSLPADESDARAAASETYVVRLAVPRPGSTRFTDLLRGEIVIENENVDDQVLVKSDGMPTYHMANVVDDHLMGVSIIMRAEEWIPSAPKHVLLYAAFGWEMPVLAHFPLLRNADKSKISKRKNPTSLLWYRRQGYLPEALLNFLALQGWSPREESEEFPIGEFIEKFDPADISVGGPVFDLTKLDWLNGEKIRKLSVEELADRMLGEGFAADPEPGGEPLVWSREDLIAALPLFQERLRTMAEFAPSARYLKRRPAPDMEGLRKKAKKTEPAALAAALQEAADALAAHDGHPDDEREAALRAVAETHALKPGEVFMGLRVAITGVTASPPILPSVDVLGTSEAVQRVRALAGLLAGS